MRLVKEIQKLFPLLEKHFAPAALCTFVSLSAEDLCVYHIGLGTWIHNTYLQPENIPYRVFTEAGFCQTDTMSSFILQLWHIHLRESFSTK